MQNYLTEQYKKHRQNLIGNHLSWLEDARESALTYFMDKGLPTTRHENFKYTNLEKLGKTAFELSIEKTPIDFADMENHLIDADNYRMVFINGLFHANYSKLPLNKPGVYLANLPAALHERNAVLEPYWKNQAITESTIALNTVLHNDGVVLIVEDNIEITESIEILFINDSNNMHHLRNFILLGNNAKVEIIEQHISTKDNEFFKTLHTEVYLNTGAQIAYYQCQLENEKAYFLNTINVQQNQHCLADFFSFDCGGKLIRRDVNVNFEQSLSQCQLRGLYFTRNKQHVDNHTLINHAVPDCKSTEIYKGIVADKSRAVFNGRVIVHKDAQKTDAFQKNANLLLSDDAEIDTKPELEIYANDVKCAHGASIGQLDKEALFYLQARGLDLDSAKAVLTFGFMQDMLLKIDHSKLRTKLQKTLFSALHSQDNLQELLPC